jgi:hypothetical protein
MFPEPFAVHNKECDPMDTQQATAFAAEIRELDTEVRRYSKDKCCLKTAISEPCFECADILNEIKCARCTYREARHELDGSAKLSKARTHLVLARLLFRMKKRRP